MTEQLERVRYLLDEINQTHDLEFTVRGRCEGGVIGTWLVTDPTGRRAILKFNKGMAHRIARVPGIVDRIRAAGYPTPAWLVAGLANDRTAYHIVDFVAGEPLSTWPLTARMAARLVRVIEGQAGLDPDPAQDWSRYVGACAFGEDDTDPRPFLRCLGRPGVELLEHFDVALAPYVRLELPTNDLVHGDFNTCNVLAHHGDISAVIDVDACGSGTRAVDYAWLLREAYTDGAGPDVIDTIHRAGEAVAGPGVLTICAAATAFDMTRFQHVHQPEDLPRQLAGLHRLADGLKHRDAVQR